MVKAKIAVNGYGTIGKRVADAIQAQDDKEVSTDFTAVGYQVRYHINAPAVKHGAFENAGMPPSISYKNNLVLIKAISLKNLED